MATSVDSQPSVKALTNDATVSNANQILSGYSAYSQGIKYDGSILSKAAQSYTPSTIDQIISGGQYLAEDQTILGDANLLAENIKSGVSIFGIAGTLVGAPKIVRIETGAGNPLAINIFGSRYYYLSLSPSTNPTAEQRAAISEVTYGRTSISVNKNTVTITTSYTVAYVHKSSSSSSSPTIGFTGTPGSATWTQTFSPSDYSGALYYA